MFKRILSLVIAVLVIASVAVVSASAAETDAAATGANVTSGKIYFEVPTSIWKNFKTIYAHVYAYSGEGDTQTWPSWQSKKEKCTDEGNGKWSYDLSKTGNTFYSGKTYVVIFSNDLGMETVNVIFYNDAVGDTVYCDGTIAENSVDSEKKSYNAYFRNHKNYGPLFEVTSSGTVQGIAIPATTTKEEVYAKFCTEIDADTGTTKLASAAKASGKSEESIKAEVRKALGITEAAASSAVSKAESNNSSSGTKNPSSSNSNKTNGSSTSTGNSTGSTVASGEGTTAIFVMVGLMVAAASVMFVARKKKD